jgi:hypothetical protein
MQHYLTQTQITILHTHARYQHHHPHHLYFFNPHLQNLNLRSKQQCREGFERDLRK